MPRHHYPLPLRQATQNVEHMINLCDVLRKLHVVDQEIIMQGMVTPALATKIVKVCPRCYLPYPRLGMANSIPRSKCCGICRLCCVLGRSLISAQFHDESDKCLEVLEEDFVEITPHGGPEVSDNSGYVELAISI